MGRTIILAKAFCLILLALCSGLADSSLAEAPAPQDSLWSAQWNMKNTGQSGGMPGIDVGLLGAWEFTTGSSLVTVAVIGAAADVDHPDFVPATGSIRINPEGDQGPVGTSIAGIIAAEANNGGAIKRGIAGIDQGCAVLTYEQYNDDKIEAAVNSGASVIELNFADEDPEDAKGEALAYAYRNDVVLIAPTGDGYSEDPRYPAALDGVIGVGGMRDDGIHRVHHSNYGVAVDLVAPDGDEFEQTDHWVTSLTDGGGYTKVRATDYAAAHVVGAASLLRGAHPELTNDDIANVLQLSARDISPTGWDVAFGHGLLKIDSAFRILQMPNTLRHLTVTSAPSVYSVTGEYACTFFDLEGLAPGVYFVKRYEIRAEVVFPHSYYNLAGAWGLGNSTNGFSSSGANLGIGFAEFVEETLTSTGGTIRTYVYEILTDLWGFPVGGFRPCAPNEVSFGYSALGEELLVTPTLHAAAYQDYHWLYWTDALSNEAEWHVDRKVSGNPWQTDYAVLPAGTNHFADSNIELGSVFYRYRIRPTNIHQTPDFSEEEVVSSRPKPPSCISARVMYVNTASHPWNPAVCSQNNDTCSGYYEEESFAPGGGGDEISLGVGDGGAATQDAGGGGGSPNCERTTAVIVSWRPPENQYTWDQRRYRIVKYRPSGDSLFAITTATADTFCVGANQYASLSVLTMDDNGEYSDPIYTALYTGHVNWCEQTPEKRAISGDLRGATTPSSFALNGNWPNPFNAGTVFSVTLAEQEDWSIEVFDVLGRSVRKLQGADGPGEVSIPFDGRSDSGQELASGVYFWRVTTPSASGARKMVVVK